jgi:hypothetical protein
MTALKPVSAGQLTETAPLAAVSAAPRDRWGRRVAHAVRHPLTAICAVQAALSLALIWSNTAYIDEADYLWIGHLMLAHWEHGATVPDLADRLSGSPVLYPPIGALADDVAGLAGARILSMIFMICATVLLYSVASKLIGRIGAVVAAALWAVSEPALRLAFATYDPMSVLLTAVSAWLIVQAGYRRRPGALVAASGLALALANVTAYSGIVIDPFVVAFAFGAWAQVMPARRALLYAGEFTGALVALFIVVLYTTHSSEGTTAVFNRQTLDHENLTLVLQEIWSYSGFVVVLALLGTLIAIRAETRQRAAHIALMAAAALAVPAAQVHYQTAWSADKHVAYGIWFAAIAAAYGCAKILRWPAGAQTRLATAACVAALIFPAITGFQTAWGRYQKWPNSAPFIAALRPAVATAPGFIYVPGHEQNIAQYYLPEGVDWTRWTSALALDPAGLPTPVPRSGWARYYQHQLSVGHYGIIALFYNTTFASTSALPGSILLSPHGGRTYDRLLNLVGSNSGALGLPTLTLALEKDPAYQLVGVGPYDASNLSGSHNYGVFAIWKWVG